MEIQLDENTLLSTDVRNWIISKKVNNKKSDEGFIWSPQRFYGSPGQAIRSEANREIRESEAKSFLEAVEDVKRIAKKYDDILTILEDLK